MTKITESGGTQEIKSTEPPSDTNTIFFNYPKNAENVNGRWVMLGIVAFFRVNSYTGQIFSGNF